VPITIDSTWIAVDMAAVREIGGPVTWIALPTANATFPGVAAWRGRAIAIADLAAVLGAGERLVPPSSRGRTLYLQQGASTLAVPVDTVREPLTVADGDVRLLPLGALFGSWVAPQHLAIVAPAAAMVALAEVGAAGAAARRRSGDASPGRARPRAAAALLVARRDCK